MHAVLAGNGVISTVLLAGLNARSQHWPEYIGKVDLLFCRHFDSDVAECAEIQIQILDRTVCAFDPGRQFSHTTCGALNHADAIRFEGFVYGCSLLAIGLSNL